MTRNRKMIALPDWYDRASVANFFTKIVEDSHKQMFSHNDLARDRYETAIIKLSQAYYQACSLDDIPEDDAQEMLRVVACLLSK